MRNFIANSACCGRRPRGVDATKLRPRPRLLKKMMANRNVARFVVAPQGFGKTHLVYEYADSIFGFDDVFWVNGQSPCFLRDLDDGIVASSLLAAAPRRSLAVFEDVPYLDDERSDAFSRDLDRLLAKDWEAVVVTTPALDSFAERQNDRACIGARDLLVDDAEAQGPGVVAHGDKACHRVPSLAWGGADGASSLLEGMRSPDMPAEIQLAVFVMEVLVEGSLEDVSSFVRGLRKDTRRFIEEHYPYVGLDLVEERFSAHEFPVSSLDRAFRGVIDSTIARATSSGREAVLFRLADLLVRRGRFERACDLMAALCPRRRRAAWIEAEQDTFLAAGKLRAMQNLFESLGERPAGLTPGLLAGAAARLHLLGDRPRAFRFASRAMGHADCTEEQACIAALVACASAEGDRCSRARAVLANAAARSFGAGSALSRAAAARVREGDASAALAALEEAGDAALSAPAFLAELSLVVRAARAQKQGGFESGDTLARATALAERCLGLVRAAHGAPDLFEALLCDEVGERAWDGPRLAERRKAAAALSVSVVEQGRLWRASCGHDLPARASRAVRVDARDVAPMRVRLFGGIEVAIGERTVSPEAFRKQKAKTLLAVLVLHRGKEVARQEMFDILWPDSSSTRAANNFYSLWSALRRALEDDQGSCPYLVRHQASCMVDARHVKSDVDEFEGLCRMLSFGRPDAQAWMEAFARLQDDFSCDLLPSERTNAYIGRLRERYRTRLTDAYITAAERLCDAREPQAALWFAHAALDGSRVREDAYCALMRAQMLAGQRSLAMETFVACRDFMAEELGMDPSERIARLHRELISAMHA